MSDVTRILSAIGAGDPQAAEELLPLVYDELRKLAAAKLAHEKPGQTLNATALVHEAYVRLVGARSASKAEESLASASGSNAFANRRHFFAAAAEAMRRILIDNARRKNRERHGGGMVRVELDSDIAAAPDRDERLVAINDALERFTERDPQKAELVKLRTFGGLSLDEAAEVVGVSPSTADRWWAYARAWLKVEISDKNPQ